MQLLKNYGVIAANSPQHKLLGPYLDAMSARPSGQHIWLINRLLIELARGGYPMTGWLALLNGETSQASRLNVFNPAQTFSVVGSPTFTANVGWRSGASASNRLDAVAFSSISGWALTDNHIGCWLLDSNDRNAYDIGALSQTNYGIVGYSTASSLGFYGRNLAATAAAAGLSDPPNAIGMSVNSRLSSSGFSFLRNGVSKATAAVANANDYSATVMSALTVVTTYADRTMAVATAGRGLTTAEALVQYNALNRFISSW